MAYFDVGPLTVDDERVPCVCLLDFAGLGFLDPCAHSEDLASGSRVDLPLWLARLLQQKGYVGVEFPKHFGDGFREHLDAGPASVNLRQMSTSYFDVGVSLSTLKRDDDLARKLLFAFTGERFRRIMDLSFNRWAFVVLPHVLKLSL